MPQPGGFISIAALTHSCAHDITLRFDKEKSELSARHEFRHQTAPRTGNTFYARRFLFVSLAAAK